MNWSETKVLNGEIGDFVTIARKQRNTDNWFLGGITDENSRTFSIKLNFLDDNASYTAIIYKDGENAQWDKNPLSIEIEKKEMTSKDILDVKLAEGGGVAISFIKNK